MTVVETVQFLRDAEDLMSDRDRTTLVEFVGANPNAGDSRHRRHKKAALGVAGKGKRGGARVIYLFHNGQFPVFLLAIYGKSEKANLNKSEQNTMAKVVLAIIQSYPGGRGTK